MQILIPDDYQHATAHLRYTARLAGHGLVVLGDPAMPRSTCSSTSRSTIAFIPS